MHPTRRTFVLGATAGGIAAWAGLPSLASADPLAYDSSPAFDVAQAGYLASDPQHNEAGLYAWGESYFLLSLLRMYEAYQDERYLRTFEDRARHVMRTTDHARHVVDYAGRSGKVWRTAGNYTAGHGVLPDGTGKPAVQLRWAGTRSAESTAEVSNVADSTFTLVLRNPGTTAVVTLRNVDLDPTSPAYVVTAVNNAYNAGLRWTAVELRDAPAAAPAPAAGSIAFQPQYYVFAVHTGMIAFPLARYARMVLQSSKLRSRHKFAREVLDAATQAVAFHDPEWDGTGNYVWPKGAPIPFDGTIQPYNQSQALGQVMVELFRVTKQPRYRTRVQQLLKSYQPALRPVDGAYVWTYWPPYSELYAGYPKTAGISEYTPSYPASTQVEDLSHAAISTEFVHAAYDAGIDGGPATDVQAFAKTFTQKLIRSANEVWFRLDGTGDAVPANAVQCARWGEYAEQDLLIYQQSLRVYDAVQLQPVQGSHALGIAYLNWAKNSGWRNK
ncbi:hypothetical protein JOF29_007448 [Kribbella aluminosa]|uniref:D-glucuronyl C5-epimerase C-terminal domain-containing protein n=1 Tax=Kribbella aluminosa TaxID=416017 RepID=A0ABS4UXF3_9ACTN|nr:hypothetical protein [Kribbella aluminosa]MBP2356338.1 hypothetical protein [Kribbella aluminosa]